MNIRNIFISFCLKDELFVTFPFLFLQYKELAFSKKILCFLYFFRTPLFKSIMKKINSQLKIITTVAILMSITKKCCPVTMTEKKILHWSTKRYCVPWFCLLNYQIYILSWKQAPRVTQLQKKISSYNRKVNSGWRRSVNLG